MGGGGAVASSLIGRCLHGAAASKAQSLCHADKGAGLSRGSGEGGVGWEGVRLDWAGRGGWRKGSPRPGSFSALYRSLRANGVKVRRRSSLPTTCDGSTNQTTARRGRCRKAE